MSLIDLVRQGWGREAVRVEPLRLGHDADARTFRADLSDGTALFLKLKGSLPSGLATVARFRFDFVPSPLSTLEGAPALWTDERWIVAYPFVEGENGLQKPLTLPQWRAFGAALRQVHDLPSEVGSYQMSERFDPEGWEEVRDLLEIARRRLEGDAARELVGVVEANRAALGRLLVRARELGHACRKEAWPFVLCHADAHVGNVLVDRAGGIHLIDWDEPRLAPRERDLMFVVDGGIADWHGPAEEAAFFEGYGPYEADPTLLSYYRHAWAVSDLAAWSKEALHPAEDDSTQGGEALRFFAGLFEPGGIVGKALA